MTARPTVSIVIVSRGRPAALSLCLTALGGIAYHPFEVVVAGCEAGLAAVAVHPLGARVVAVRAPGANVAAARNLGLARAGGEVIAFLDDDAIPEPFWLDHLVHPLALGMAELAGGFVTGRNGFDLQWGARSVDRTARHRALSAPGPEPFVPPLGRGEALRTEGTNMAANRAALAALGGFDTGYAYYLDDTDLNMRAGDAGVRTASVPRARVWHRQLPSSRRGADRVPLDLTDIGRSLARYLDRHAPPGAWEEARAFHRAEERRRALRHMVRGTLGPDEVGRLLRGFDRGFGEGAEGSAAWDGAGAASFRPFRDGPPADLPGLFERIGWGFRAHRLAFEAPGHWVRRGGRWGRRRNRETEFTPGLYAMDRASPQTGAILRKFSPFDEKL